MARGKGADNSAVKTKNEVGLPEIEKNKDYKSEMNF